MPTVLAATIQARKSLSEPLDLTGVTAVVGIIMPQDWTPAVMTIQGSPLGVNFYDLHDGFPGVELTLNVKPWTMLMINPNRLRCCTAIKIRSGTQAAPVAQANFRQIGVVVEGDVEQAYPTPFDPSEPKPVE